MIHRNFFVFLSVSWVVEEAAGSELPHLLTSHWRQLAIPVAVLDGVFKYSNTPAQCYNNANIGYIREPSYQASMGGDH